MKSRLYSSLLLASFWGMAIAVSAFTPTCIQPHRHSDLHLKFRRRCSNKPARQQTLAFLQVLMNEDSFAAANSNIQNATFSPANMETSSADDDSKNEHTTNLDDIEALVTEDPLSEEWQLFQEQDFNSKLNTGILLLVGALVLWQVGTIDQGLTRGWTASEIAMGIPLHNWDTYNAVLAASPISTKAVTSATVYTIGDVIAQKTEGESMGTLDRTRILRSLLAGLIGHGPLSHVWYNLSETWFEAWNWTGFWSFIPKVALDQMTWGPFWNNMYILMLGIMKGQNFDTMISDMKRTTIPLIVSGLKLWPLAHCVTYGLVPVENRLLWVDLVEIVWVTILATQAAGVHPHDDGQPGNAAESPKAPKASEAQSA